MKPGADRALHPHGTAPSGPSTPAEHSITRQDLAPERETPPCRAIQGALPPSGPPGSPSHPRPDPTIGRGRSGSALPTREDSSGRQRSHSVFWGRKVGDPGRRATPRSAPGPCLFQPAVSPAARARHRRRARSPSRRRARTLHDRRPAPPRTARTPARPSMTAPVLPTAPSSGARCAEGSSPPPPGRSETQGPPSERSSLGWSS